MLSPKPNVERLAPARHGGINYIELEKLNISPRDILDFSVSTNPFGPPPGLWEALDKPHISDYPDSVSTNLRLLLAEKLHISPENILIGSGSTELIRLVAMAYFGRDDQIFVLQPTYSEYEIACCLVEATVIKLNVLEENGFQPHLSEIEATVRKHHPRGMFLCNPNNPTGQYFSHKDIEQILTMSPNSLVVLDEAYIGFSENIWSSLDLIHRDNLVILRSMTKDYALAGLRLGYAVAGEPIVSVLNKVKPPWNVNVLAQMAGVYALQSGNYLEKCCLKIKEVKAYLIEGLQTLGLQPLPSRANFFLVKVGDATGVREALIKRGILVRDCTSFGLPEYIRLAPRILPECQKLITALKQIEVKRYAG